MSDKPESAFIRAQEVACIRRFDKLDGGSTTAELLTFLSAEKLISDVELNEFKLSADRPQWLRDKVNSLKNANKIQLLEYEWTLLPVERIKITVVTDSTMKTFRWNSQ